ncbi:hypothetical protein TSUD_189070 [Trifolium subterraneum]|uniref:Uncharacterized protein n=1 Tax=Trifolium subterraneum TaxID=3900 RepID=A0A2Z6PFN2_TRISU|nr:hypothetical protein TSUD_189070 [Trifolium subterraneum]
MLPEPSFIQLKYTIVPHKKEKGFTISSLPFCKSGFSMVESDYVPLPDYNEIGAVKKGTETSRTVQEQRKKDDISAPQGPITGQASGSAASSSGQSAEQAPPSPPAGIYAAPRIEHSIGGPLVSAVGTPVNLTPAGHMAYELGPDSETVMPGEPINLGPMTYPMQYTYAQPHYVDLIDDVNHIESGYVPLPDYNERRAVKKGTETSRTVQERRKGVIMFYDEYGSLKWRILVSPIYNQ